MDQDLAEKLFFPLAASRHNLARLLAIRLIVFICQLAALLYGWRALQLSLNYPAILAVFGGFVLVNLGLWLRLQQGWAVTQAEFLGHLLLDVLGLSLLLYFSGGASNPFVSYFLVPITIAAAILPWTYTWIVAGACLLSYSCLLFVYQPLPALMPAQPHGSISNLHTLGMWFNFLVSAALITYFVVKMAQEIRTRETQLTIYRENNLRDEQILAVATQAAGTAHQLGTPLSTMAVVLREMELEHPYSPALQEDLALLQQQIAQCKGILRELTNQADIRSKAAPRQVLLTDFIRQVMDQWQLLRPEARLHFSVEQPGDAPLILQDSTLQQAIVNLLNNAADASQEQVEVHLYWDDREWGLRIHDQGKGIRADIAGQVGNRFVSTKAEGMGVGLLLSHASIERMKGQLRIVAHDRQGTLTEVVLPLAGGAGVA